MLNNRIKMDNMTKVIIIIKVIINRMAMIKIKTMISIIITKVMIRMGHIILQLKVKFNHNHKVPRKSR